MQKRRKQVAKWSCLVLVGTSLVATPLFAKDYAGHWAEGAIDKWSSYGVVKGIGNGDFAPSASVTRAELATFISRTFQYTAGESVRNYTDIEEGKWYTQAVTAISSRGLMYIPSSKFEPNKPATREEVVYTIAKAYHIQAQGDKTTHFTDEATISTWAKESVQALAEKGMIKGNPDGSFRPQAPVTRAEVVTMLENITPYRIQTSGQYTEPVYNGNVMITASDVTMKDTVINGNLYIVEGIDTGSIKLDNITINGNLYIASGKVTLSGTYNEVHLASTAPFDFTKGTMKKLTVTVPNTNVNLRQNTVTDYLLVAADAKFNIEGVVKETSNSAKTLQLEEAYVIIGGNKVPLEVEGTEIVMNLSKLAARASGNDNMESMVISANIGGAYIEGILGGRMDTDVAYTFRAADKQLGMFNEMIEQMVTTSPELGSIVGSLGLSSDTLFAMLMEDGKLSIANMREQFSMMNTLARQYAGVNLPTAYSFNRTLRYENELPVKITIRLELE